MLDPFDHMDKVFDDMVGGHGAVRSFVPPVDVYQDKEHVIVEAPLAGVDPKNVSITVENDVLTLEGTHEKKSEVDDQHYYRKEIRQGSFHRAVALPAAVTGSKARATFEKGVLKVVIPKEERAKPAQVKIDIKES